VSAGDDHSLRVWDAATGEVLQLLSGHDAHIHFVTLSPNDRWLASAAFDGTVRLWDLDDGQCHQVLRLGPEGGKIWKAIFSPDGQHIATANGNGTVYILRLASLP
jgi:WD40 repeat protein